MAEGGAGTPVSPGPSGLRWATLEAAARVLAEDGPGGFSVRRVAAAAGCSTISIYHYFENKQGLLDAVLVAGHERLRQVQSAARAGGDPAGDVRDTCLAYREVALQHPHLFQVMFGPVGRGAGRPVADVQAPARENYAAFVDVVRRWDAQVGLREAPEVVAYGLWATGHGMVMLEITERAPGEHRAERYAATIDALMRGVLVETGT